jgi:hypothetical protein
VAVPRIAANTAGDKPYNMATLGAQLRRWQREIDLRDEAGVAAGVTSQPLTCPDFQTTPEFLDVHRQQAGANRLLIARAAAGGEDVRVGLAVGEPGGVGHAHAGAGFGACRAPTVVVPAARVVVVVPAARVVVVVPAAPAGNATVATRRAAVAATVSNIL